MTIRKSSKYFYKGPVKSFGETKTSCWEGVTWAPSEAKALANLSYRYKTERKLQPGAKIELNPDYIMELSAVQEDYEYYDEEMRRMLNESVQM